MATMLEIRDDIINYLYNNWADTDVSWPNKTYIPSSGTSFIKIFFRGGISRDLEIGRDGADLNTFSLFIDVFVPVDSGNRNALIYAEKLRALFVNYDKKDVNLIAPAIIELGENKGFYQVRVSIPVQAIFYPL